MESIKKAAVLLYLVVLVAAAFVPDAKALVTYTMHGAYWEDGTSAGAINATMSRAGEPDLTFELNGTYLANATTGATLFTFDLGFNTSRTYYTINQTAETIYVYKPSEPYYTYFVEMLDYIGLQWGYLETVINVGGSDRVVERWRTDVLNDMPFVLTWGKAYVMRLVCNRGTYVFGSFVAGATTTFTLAVTSDLFPAPETGTGGITARGNRMNSTWIQAYYSDVNLETNWTLIEIFEFGSNIASVSYNSTSQTITYNWYEAASDMDYVVQITIQNVRLGEKSWTFPCPAPISNQNPFNSLSLLGTFPFAANQVPAVLILLVVGMAFSWYSIPWGMIVQVVVAAILVWLGWLAIGWSWLTISGTMILILAIAEAKQREVAVG